MFSLIYKRFYNYLEVPRKMPRILLFILRIFSLVGIGGFLFTLYRFPDLGNLILWGIIIPLLPLLIFIAPGMWRNICPAASLNQIPRKLKLGLKLKLGGQARTWSYLIASIMFFILILVNLVESEVQYDYSLMIVSVFLIAGFLMGFIFEGKGGWCGTFCPFSPLERVWGSTPILNSRNGFCKSCVGCQKNCMDFNPRAAFISDLYDVDSSYRNVRVLFMVFLPGFFAGLFFPPLAPSIFGVSLIGNIFAFSLISVGVFHLIRAYLPISPYRVAHVYVLISFGIFYYGMLPQILANITLLETAITNDYIKMTLSMFSEEYLTLYYIFIGFLMVLSLFISIVHELRFTLIGTLPSVFRVNVDKLLRSIKEFTDGMMVSEETNELSFSIFEGQTLLNALENAEFHIESGCRMGICGSDPVAITENEDNLSPITPEEADTLSRLGLLGHARLACMTTVTGSVGISMDCFSNHAKDLATAQKSNIGWGMLDIPERQKHSDDPLRGRKVVVLGNGVAGMSTVQYLRRLSPGVEITVATNEIYPFYNRMGLVKLLENRLYSVDNMILLPPDWYEQSRIQQMLNTKISRINLESKTVYHGQHSDKIEYDILVLALGAKPHTPDIQGIALEGSFTVRSMEDMTEINNYIQKSRVKKITVVGGGWQGIEIATMLRKRNYEITLVHAYENLLNKLGNPKASQILKDFLINQIRLNVECQTGVSRISGQSNVEKVHLTQQDKTVSTDLCIFSTGVEGNADFVSKSAIRCGQYGIRINRKMETSEEGIYAIGDCAEILEEPIGLWGTAMEMGKVAALNIAGQPTEFDPDMCLLPRILKIPQIDFRCFGKTTPGSEDRMFEGHDPVSNKYWSVIVNGNNYMIGGIFINQYEMANSLYKAMRFRLDISQLLPVNLSEEELMADEAAEALVPNIPFRR